MSELLRVWKIYQPRRAQRFFLHEKLKKKIHNKIITTEVFLHFFYLLETVNFINYSQEPQ